MSNTEINLLKRDAHTNEFLLSFEENLRVAAWWSLIGLLGVGIIIGTFFVVLSARAHRLEQDSARLGQQINAQLVKEGILLSLKQRTVIAGKALDAARPWGNLFPLLAQITGPSDLRMLSVDEAGKVSVTIKVYSIDDAATIVANIIALTEQGSLRLPQLLSFSVHETGEVQMGVLFVPIL